MGQGSYGTVSCHANCMILVLFCILYYSKFDQVGCVKFQGMMCVPDDRSSLPINAHCLMQHLNQMQMLLDREAAAHVGKHIEHFEVLNHCQNQTAVSQVVRLHCINKQGEVQLHCSFVVFVNGGKSIALKAFGTSGYII